MIAEEGVIARCGGVIAGIDGVIASIEGVIALGVIAR